MTNQIESDLEVSLFKELRQLAEMPDASTKEMHKVCDYLYWAQISLYGKVEMKFEITEDQVNQCSVSLNHKKFSS